MDEELLDRMEVMLSGKFFRNRSHVVEYAVKKLVEDEKDLLI